MAPNDSGISIEKRNNRSHAAQYGKEPVIKETDNPRSGLRIYILPDARKEIGKEKQFQVLPSRFVNRAEQGNDGRTAGSFI